MKNVLQAIEDRLFIFNLPGLGGIRLLLAALEVGVHFTSVRGVLFIVRDLDQTQGNNPESDLTSKEQLDNVEINHLQGPRTDFRI